MAGKGRHKGPWIELRYADDWDDLLLAAAEQFLIKVEGWHSAPLTAVVHALRGELGYRVGLVEIEDPDEEVPAEAAGDLAKLEWHVLAPGEPLPPDVAGSWSLLGYRVVWCWPADPAVRKAVMQRHRVRSEQYAGPRTFFGWQFSDDLAAFARQIADKLEEYEEISLGQVGPEQLPLVLRAVAVAEQLLRRSHAELNCLPRYEEQDGHAVYSFVLKRS